MNYRDMPKEAAGGRPEGWAIPWDYTSDIYQDKIR